MNSQLNFTLEPSNSGHQESLNAESGVGANAASKGEIEFVEDEHLYELVWSPRKGVSTRPAVGSALEKKSPIFWEVEQSEMVLSPTYKTAAENNIREFVNLLTMSPVEKDSSYAMNRQMCSGSSEKVVETNTSSQKCVAKDTVGPGFRRDEGNCNTMRAAEATGSNSPGLEDGRTSNLLPITDESHPNTRHIEFNPRGLTDMKISGSVDRSSENGRICPLSPVKGNLLQEVTNFSLMEDAPNKMTEVFSTSNSDLGKRNILQGGKEQFQLEVFPVSKASPLNSFASKRKEKEEAGDDSDSNGNFRRCKRVKLQIPGKTDLAPFTNSNGSFVNWISALTKGLSKPVANMGFQSLFASLYQPKPKGQDQTLSSFDDAVAPEQKMESDKSLKQCVDGDDQDSQIQLSHLWLTHFCPKSSGQTLNSAHGEQGHSCKKSHTPLNVEVSCAVKRIEGEFKHSEAMVSIFAKRLDALKQIMVDKATSSTITCIFCGTIGHDLQDCPQLTKTELNQLLNDMTTKNAAEKSYCFCIKCFQLNHWAIACPNATQVQHGADVLHQPGLDQMLHNLELAAGVDVNMEIGESSDAPAISHTCSSLGKQVVDKPNGIFEAVRSLRLSRTDVLKWMNSMVSISYLDGYYLRLRLGKPEEGLGGTGYHVACISGLHEEKAVETSKKPISVIVGGIRCSIESQYISNQDFLEDELMAWWSVTVRGGGKIPSEDELVLKLKERERLGI